MISNAPKITVCIPHWQILACMQPCLRSIRKHSAQYDLEVIVVDNGSRDASLDYLRALDWIRLIERPEEVHTNWPGNVFTAWDRGLREARGDFYVTMHSDVFVKRDGWLDPFLREIARDASVAASGAWKFELENPIYAWQKKAIGFVSARVKRLFGRKLHVGRYEGKYPRDYCAMYRRDTILKHGLTFGSVKGYLGGGYSIARQIWDAGYGMGMFPVREMDRYVYHINHGTAAVIPEKRLRRLHKQRQSERKAAALFEQPWIRELQADVSLDRRRAA